MTCKDAGVVVTLKITDMLCEEVWPLEENRCCAAAPAIGEPFSVNCSALVTGYELPEAGDAAPE